MELYLNLPLKAGMVLVLTDRTNTYKQLGPTRFRFFPSEPTEVVDKIATRFLDEKRRKLDDGSEVGFVSERPFDGNWPSEVQVPQRMPMRRTRAGQLRSQGDPGTHVARRLPSNMQRQNSQLVTEIESDVASGQLQESDVETYLGGSQSTAPDTPLKDDGDERFTRIERNDRLAGLKLKSLATKTFLDMKGGQVGMAVKALGFKFADGLALDVRQEALELMCEIVTDEVEIPE